MIKVCFVLCVLYTSVVSKTKSDSYPYVVSLEAYSARNIFEGRLCTGSALSRNWILTAAHCIDKRIARARYGDISLHSNHLATSVSRILKRIPHPGYRKVYNKFRHEYSVNDISLFLAESMILQSYASITSVYYKTMIGLPIKCHNFGITVINDENHYHYRPSINVPTEESTSKANKVIMLEMKEVVRCKGPKDGGPAICTVPKCGLKFSTTSAGDIGGPLLYEGKIVGIAGMDLTTAAVRMQKFVPATVFMQWIAAFVNSTKHSDHLDNTL